MAECKGKPEGQKSGCGDAYQLIRDLNMVLVGIVASYFLEVMWSSGGAAPLHVLEGPGSPYFPSAPGASVVIAGSAVLIPMFWEKYFPTASRLQILQAVAGGLILVRGPAHPGGRPTNRGGPARVGRRPRAQGALRRGRIRISGPVDRRAEAPLELVVRTADSVAT